MNNKQVPEEIKQKINEAVYDYGMKKQETGWSNSLSEIKEHYRLGVEYGYSLASLPAEPSTPETKDKPATGLGGGAEGIEEIIIDLQNTATALRANGQKAAAGFIDQSIAKLATLRQPTGTVYVPCLLSEAKYFLDTHEGEIPVKPIQFMPEREGADVGFYCSDAADTGNEDLRCINQCPKCKTFLQSTGEGINE